MPTNKLMTHTCAQARAPAGLKLSSSVALILGVPAAITPPALGTAGVPHAQPTVPHIMSPLLAPPRSVQQCATPWAQARISEASLQGVAAGCLKACDDVVACLEGVGKTAAALQQSHERGAALQNVPDFITTLALSYLEAQLEEKRKQEVAAGAARDYLAAHRIKEEIQVVEEGIELFKGLVAHVAEVHRHMLEAQEMLLQGVLVVGEIISAQGGGRV
jgi:hypothetical protein